MAYSTTSPFSAVVSLLVRLRFHEFVFMCATRGSESSGQDSPRKFSQFHQPPGCGELGAMLLFFDQKRCKISSQLGSHRTHTQHTHHRYAYTCAWRKKNLHHATDFSPHALSNRGKGVVLTFWKRTDWMIRCFLLSAEWYSCGSVGKMGRIYAAPQIDGKPKPWNRDTFWKRNCTTELLLTR